MKHLTHNPTRDWYLVLGTMTVAVIAVFGWAYWFHSTIGSAEPIESATGAVSTDDVLDRNVLEKTDRQFLERSAEYDRVRINAPRAVDPAE